MQERMVVESEFVRSKGEKAREVANWGRRLVSYAGVSEKIAGVLAIHELKHALADTGSGFFRFHLIPEGGSYAEYVYVGERTAEERLKIFRAPGRDMSKGDRDGMMAILALEL